VAGVEGKNSDRLSANDEKKVSVFRFQARKFYFVTPDT
jgi:hypothetical protein